MADLSQFVMQRQLPRRPRATQAAGRGARLQPIRGAPTGQGLGALGHGLQVLGQNLAQADAQFERAKAGIVSTEALVGFLDEMQQTHTEIVSDPSIFPTDRGAMFRERIEPRIAEIQQTLPILGQESFLRGAQSNFLRLERNMIADGRQEAITRGRQITEEAMVRLGDALVAVDNEVDEQGLLSEAREVIGQAVANGLLTRAEGLERLRTLRQDATVTRAELQTREDPEGMLEQFMQGPEANPDIPPDELVRLIDVAQREFDESIRRIDALDAQMRRHDEEQQDALASQYRIALSRLDITIPQLQEQLTRINADREAGDLSEADHRELTNSIQARHDKLSSPAGRQDEDIVAEAHVRLATAFTPDALAEAQEYILANRAHMSSATLGTLLGKHNQARQDTSLEFIPQYQSAKRILVRAAVPLGDVDVSMESLDNRMMGKLRRALDMLESEMLPLFQAGQVRDIQLQAEDAARRIKTIFFPIPGGEVSRPPLPAGFQDLTHPERLRMLDSMDMSEDMKDAIYESIIADRELQQRREELQQKGANDEESSFIKQFLEYFRKDGDN